LSLLNQQHGGDLLLVHATALLIIKQMPICHV